MSTSKDLYASNGWSEEFKKEPPIFEVGQRFTIDYGYNKSEKGTWEIISVDDSPLYDCKRVLQNGKLSKSDSMKNSRRFYVDTIKQALGEELYYCIGYSPSVNGEEQFSVCKSIDEAKTEIERYGNHHEYCAIEKGYENSEEREVVFSNFST